MTKTNTYKTNKQMHEKHTDQLPLPQGEERDKTHHKNCSKEQQRHLYTTGIKLSIYIQQSTIARNYL